MNKSAAHDAAWLSTEAKHLHLSLFSSLASQDFIARYVTAHDVLAALAECPNSETAAVKRIVDQRLDVAAIEPWLRGLPGRRHMLCRKVLLALHLSECGGDRPKSLQPLNADIGWPLAWLMLLSLGVKSAFRLALGRFLIARYGLR